MFHSLNRSSLLRVSRLTLSRGSQSDSNKSGKSAKNMWLRWLPPIGIGLLLVGIWYLATRTSEARFVIASPQDVVNQFRLMLANGTLIQNTLITLIEVGIGLLLGISSAFVLGYAIAHSHLLERTLGPYVVGFQAVPLIVIAPILSRILGPGLITNGIICALIIFFPMLVNTTVSIRSIDPTLRDLMRSMTATRWQTFRKLELPAALPGLLGGLKISVTLGVIGAVVAEAVSPRAGLGFLIYSSQYTFNIAGALVGVFTLTVFALLLYEIAARLERRLLAWRQR